MILKRNLKIGPKLKVSSWRKMAQATYKVTGDSQAYCLQTIQVDKALKLVEESNGAFNLTHLVGRACGQIIKENPEINRIIRFGRFYQREDISVFFQVALDQEGKDLSGYAVRDIDQKGPEEISKDMQGALSKMKKGDDFEYKKAKKNISSMPSFLLGPVLKLYGFFLYGLNLWGRFLGAPRDPFGSMMVTNIGSLGLRAGFAPLVSYSRCPLILAFGEAHEKVIAENGEAVVRTCVDCGWTLDHRVVDGVIGAKMAKQFQFLIENPEELIKKGPH